MKLDLISRRAKADASEVETKGKLMNQSIVAFTLAVTVTAVGIAGAQTGTSSTTESHPVIPKYGKVVRLPKAAQQPRSDSRIVVDITKGGDPAKLNSAIEKVARFVNIYGGGGTEPASVDIAVVLHGDATLTILNADAYAKRFETSGNPNLDCLAVLRRVGVKFYVCGQSLISKGASVEEVDDSCEVAVSALTSLVNLQHDGYAYVPLGN